MSKIDALLSDLDKAAIQLKKAIDAPVTDLHRDATIQRFEFTFELAWKLVQAVIIEQGLTAYGPKNVFREAAKLGLIDDPLTWFDFLDKRNKTTHRYDEKEAEKIYAAAKNFYASALDLITRIKSPKP